MTGVHAQMSNRSLFCIGLDLHRRYSTHDFQDFDSVYYSSVFGEFFLGPPPNGLKISSRAAKGQNSGISTMIQVKGLSETETATVSE